MAKLLVVVVVMGDLCGTDSTHDRMQQDCNVRTVMHSS